MMSEVSAFPSALLRVEREACGREILVACSDIKPGMLLFSEAPLVTVHVQCGGLEKEYSIVQTGIDPLDICRGFAKALPAQQEKFLQMYATTNAQQEIAFRMDLATNAPEMIPNMDKWVKVCFIFFQHSYHRGNGVPKDVSAASAVYEWISKVKHSCTENVTRVPDGDEKYACRAICHIKAGEPLTISHVDDRAMESTWWRRYSILKLKGFTCHCARCEAEGDDTRQFDCFDTACAGFHVVREPLNKDTLSMPYEGVTYEVPRMLPCTVCHRNPPAEYVQRMFAWEKSVHSQIHGAYDEGRAARKRDDAHKLGAIIHRLLDVILPRRHSDAHHLACARDKLFNLATSKSLNLGTAAVRCEEADVHAAEVVDAILPGAHPEKVKRWLSVAITAKFSTNAVVKKERLQKCLRLCLIINGREERDDGIEPYLAAALAALPQMAVQGTAVCAFCEESPDNAELKLSRCGACKKVAYCSKGCQKAHWPLHKLQCAKK